MAGGPIPPKNISIIDPERIGITTLSDGIATVLHDSIVSTDNVMVSCQTAGGVQGVCRVDPADIIDNTSFIIRSSSLTDTSTYLWWILR